MSNRSRDALPRYLVALDNGKTFGWAHGHFSDLRPDCGTWQLAKADADDLVGCHVEQLRELLEEAFDEWRPTHIIMAETFMSRSRADAELSLGRLGAVRGVCWRRNIRFRVQPEGTVRREILGRGGAPTEVMKALVLEWCAREGIEVHGDHNAGDACVMWRWARDEYARRFAPIRGLLD